MTCYSQHVAGVADRWLQSEYPKFDKISPPYRLRQQQAGEEGAERHGKAKGLREERRAQRQGLTLVHL